MRVETSKKYGCIRDYLGDWCKEMNDPQQGGYGAIIKDAPEPHISILVQAPNSKVAHLIGRYYNRLTAIDTPFPCKEVLVATHCRIDSTVRFVFDKPKEMQS